MDPKNFFAELKRRNVYKVAVAYAVIAWLLIQVFPFFEIPNWAVRLVVLLLIIGFPVALILAWAFELTPEGIKRADTSTGESPKNSGNQAWVYVAVTAGALSVGLFFLGRYTARQSVPVNVTTKSIAVLPFENLSEEKANAYFAEGIQEEILTRLAKIGALKVVSCTSTKQYAGRNANLSEIGRRLNVANRKTPTTARS